MKEIPKTKQDKMSTSTANCNTKKGGTCCKGGLKSHSINVGNIFKEVVMCLVLEAELF